MPADAIGLDIGGANLKAATASGRAMSRPFALWKHPDRLAGELSAIASELRPAGPVGVTMTGELCDCFPTKRDGVRHILAAVAHTFPTARARVWSTGGKFLSLEDGIERPLEVAAANWHAQATYVGRLVPHGVALLIDTGSTTTDVIRLENGRPVAKGLTDTQRLRTGELVYTGVRRTPVCALLGPAVMAEVFATTYDVYVSLGLLPEEPDNHDTADGRPMSTRHAHGRLARMVGGDELTPDDVTRALAGGAHRRQVEMIARAVARVCGVDRPQTIVASGSGEFLARAALQSVGWAGDAPRVIALSEELGPDRSAAACAFAAAVLAAEECA